MITLAKISDIEEIMSIIEPIKKELLLTNNLQWGSTKDNYPNKNQFLNDIKKKNLYIYKEDNNIKGLLLLQLIRIIMKTC